MTSLATAIRAKPATLWRWRTLWLSASLVFAALAFLAAGVSLETIPMLCLAAATPELARIDLREHRLPNRLVLPGIAVGALTWAIQSLLDRHILLTPAIAAGAFAGFLLALCLLGGVGMGDVKLAVALGLASWLPFTAVLSPVFGFLLGGVASVIVLATRNRRRQGAARVRMALGPYLLAGFWATIAIVAVSRWAA